MHTFAIGLDLGGTNARAAAVDEHGRILAVRKEQLTDRSPEACADALARCAAGVLQQLDRPPEEWAGVGMGIAGPVDARSGRVIVAPNLGWKDVDIASLIAERVGRPVQLANDLAVATLGEQRAGAARGHDDALLVFLGSGVGSGLILGGRIYRGSHGIAGEFGHMKVHPGGRRCGCGQLGCLEAYAGGVNLGRRAGELLREGRASSLQVPEGLNPTTRMLEEAAREGDALSRQLLAEAAELVGVATANVVTLLNPSVLILGGGVLQGSPFVRERVEEVVRAQALRASLEGLIIVDPTLGDDAGVIGSSFLARSAYEILIQ